MIGRIGRRTRRIVARSSDFLGMLALLVMARLYPAHGARRRIFRTLYRRQLFYTAVQGLWAIGLVAALTGFFLAFRLPRIAGGEPPGPAFAELFITVVVRELAPLMTAVIVIARSGTAVTAKIGYLKLFQQFEVLKAMGIDPVYLFLVPVFFAFPTAMLALVVYFDLIGLATALFTLWVQDPTIRTDLLLDNVLSRLDLADLGVTLAKCLVTGLVIGVLAIYHGAHIHNSVVGVAQGMSVSTSRQLVLVLFVNAIVSLVVYSR